MKTGKEGGEGSQSLGEETEPEEKWSMEVHGEKLGQGGRMTRRQQQQQNLCHAFVLKSIYSYIL